MVGQVGHGWPRHEILLTLREVILFLAGTLTVAGEHLSAIIAPGNRMGLEFSVGTTLAGHKSETYMWFRAKILRNSISVTFLQKGV